MKESLSKSRALRIPRWRESGSATLVALGILAVTLLVLCTALIEASHRYRISHHSTRWAQAGQAAEAGADIAMMSVQNGSWVANGWSAAPGTPGTAPITNTFTLGAGAPGTGPITATVSVDSVSMGGNNWLRIQSIGSATVYGGSVPGIDDNDVMLRKLSFRVNRYTNAALPAPQSMRMVEILAKPNSPFTMALLLQNQLTINNPAAVIDSFDSSDPTKSTNGLYDPAKRQSNGNAGINNTQGQTDLKNAYLYGSLAYSGPTPQNDGNVTGGVTTPFNRLATPVNAPTWTSYNATPTAILGSATLTGGTQASPALYKVSAVNLRGNNVLTLAPYAVGQQSYMEIWVTGDFNATGLSSILQQPGVNVIYHVQGNLSVSGSSFNNQNNFASSCVIDMVNPPTGTSQSVTVNGSGTFIGVIDAPGADFTIQGAASISGALIGNTMNIVSAAGIHYDEALKNYGGGGGGYTVASEVEGVR